MTQLVENLVRVIGRAFYADEHIVVLEALIREKYLKDDEMGNAVNLQTKQVRKICHELQDDHLVSRYIDYKYFVDVVRYRLYLIRSFLMEAESLEIERQTYRCDNDDCGREYTALEAQKLLTPDIHEFFCGHCNSKLIECDNNERLQSAQGLLRKFTAQVNKAEDLHDSINECLKKIQDFLNTGQALPSNLPSENRAAGQGGDSLRAPAGRGGGGGGGGGGGNRSNEPQTSLLYGNRAPEVVVAISTESKPRNEVKLEPTKTAKAIPVFLQGSTMSNDMALKYKQNNLTTSLIATTIKNEIKDELHEDDTLQAEIVLDETIHDSIEDDENQEMEWEYCETSQEDNEYDMNYYNEYVYVQGIQYSIHHITDNELEKMTRDEYVNYYHQCKQLRERIRKY